MATELQSHTRHDYDAVVKAFVHEDGRTSIVCPQCSKVKAVAVGQYRGRQHQLKVRCSCSHVFKVNLDFRQSYRKPTDLAAIYNLFPPAVGGGMSQVLNLSLSGICFEVKGVHGIKIGQKGRIDFTLNNRRATRLIRDFTVRTVRQRTIGCEFRQDQAFEKDLGFYLRFDP